MIDKNRKPNDSYVGDFFTISYMKGDKDPLARMNGLRGQLIGFKRRIRVVLAHEVNQLAKIPGFYETIGDAVIHLETGQLVEIPITNLIPEGYRFTDKLEKNVRYCHASMYYRFLRDLPFTAYNIGDKVLISQHSVYMEDFVAEILDITFKTAGVHYVICPFDKIIEVRSDHVIDVVERGQLSDLERFGRTYTARELPLEHRLAIVRYYDDENNLPNWE